MSTVALTAWMCAALVLGMLSNATFPALIPTFVEAFELSNARAGIVAGAYFAGYVAAVPVLVTLTDRRDARGIFLLAQAVKAMAAFGFALFAADFWTAAVLRAIAGAGLAGTYMVGARLLSDRVPEGTAQSRVLAWYTAHFGIGVALSVFLAGEVTALAGWTWAFLVAGLGHLAAVVIVLCVTRPLPWTRPAKPREMLLDLRPVLRNRRAMGFILGYTAHIWELFSFRVWLVPFLAFALGAGLQETASEQGITATRIATAILLLGMPASVLGNELAVRFGRRGSVAVILMASGTMACALGLVADWPMAWLIAVLALYSLVVMADSGALISGAVTSAELERRGATMAMLSLLGFGAGTLGPLAVGVVLDASGGETSGLAWVLAFATMGAGALLGPVFLALLRDRR